MNALKFLIIWFVTISASLNAQSILVIHVVDPHQRPLPFVVVKYASQNFTTDQNGRTLIPSYTSGSRINFHKLGFGDTSIVVPAQLLNRDSTSITVTMRLKITLLQEVAVTSTLTAEINPMKADFVMGFELKGSHLVQWIAGDAILVIDQDNKICSRSKSITGIQELAKDQYGNLHIITEHEAYKFDIDTSGRTSQPLTVDAQKLKSDLKYCDAADGNSKFIRRYKDNNQTMAIFATSVNSGRVKMLKEITDAARADAVQAYANETNALLMYLAAKDATNPAGVMGELNPAELQLYRDSEKMTEMLEKNYGLPPYSVIRFVNDSLYLFAHDIDSMFVYDRSWNQARAVRITYHHLKTWDKELIVNEEKTKVYARLQDKGKFMLAEVNLATGELRKSYYPINSKFPARIRIRTNTVYYMAKQKSGVGNTVYYQRF